MGGGFKREDEDDEFLPDAPSKRSRRTPRSSHPHTSNGSKQESIKTESADATHGVQLKTSFPVARIKRIMQADEDIGKVAQVTPHVVSRALELFMIKLISTAAEQAGSRGAGGGGKGTKRIQAQHLKKAIFADEHLDFLQDIASKVPDAPSKSAAKTEAGSDSEDAKPKKKGKKRKESGDDS